ncbi:hypothetical protein [Amycolatopsis sp. CA-126428]|uniref:hypothetical protein n=1 Tax=Amycolatopsis sp. CA-126428 TaxID=2073158 RepID=UPI001E3529F6|nr:hypothetical protein [Amycolatopsis sp. CA-126428]
MPRAVPFDDESARILAAAGIGDALGEMSGCSRDYVRETADGQVLFDVDVPEHGRSGWPG